MRYVYARRYPQPARDTTPLTEDDARSFGLRLGTRETYENEVTFTAEELAAYLMTHTNVIAAVEQGTETERQAWDWIFDSVILSFPFTWGTFLFRGPIWYLQKL